MSLLFKNLSVLYFLCFFNVALIIIFLFLNSLTDDIG